VVAGWHPNWQIAGKRFALLETHYCGNGVSEWVWQAGASRETVRAGSRSCCPRRIAGDLLGDGRDRLDDHDREHALQGLAALNEDNMALIVMSLRAAMNTACKFRA
jgi:hypothetical protein